MNWKDYQNKTAEVFKNAGCNADVEALVQGVRSEHKIDVFVTFEQYGIKCSWVVECKYWNRNVPKEKVLTLQRIVDDVGADRGVLISKIGFQSGAIKAARVSNITLTSLEDLAEDLKDAFSKRTIETLENNLIRVRGQIYSLSKSKSKRPSYYTFLGEILNLQRGFDNIKLGKQVYPHRFSEDGNKVYTTNSIEKFLQFVQSQILIYNKWLNSIQ